MQIQNIKQCVMLVLPGHTVIVPYEGNLTAAKKTRIAERVGRWMEPRYPTMAHAHIGVPNLVDAIGDGFYSSKEPFIIIEREQFHGRTSISLIGNRWGKCGLREDQLAILVLPEDQCGSLAA